MQTNFIDNSFAYGIEIVEGLGHLKLRRGNRNNYKGVGFS